jgi:hypothetical protein
MDTSGQLKIEFQIATLPVETLSEDAYPVHPGRAMMLLAACRLAGTP